MGYRNGALVLNELTLFFPVLPFDFPGGGQEIGKKTVKSGSNLVIANCADEDGDDELFSYSLTKERFLDLIIALLLPGALKDCTR